VESIGSTSNKLNQRKGCFQLFGFDVLLAEDYKLWLIEVNLSPACEARTTWLEDMLVAMSEGLLNIILPKEIAWPFDAHSKYYWHKIYE
jgi:hypothetical protein